jgi:hypothetical protein
MLRIRIRLANCPTEPPAGRATKQEPPILSFPGTAPTAALPAEPQGCPSCGQAAPVEIVIEVED